MVDLQIIRYPAFSTLEIVFCVFAPLKGVLNRMAENNFVKALSPLKGVLNRVLTYSQFIGVRMNPPFPGV
jgi:hypothetical protein